MKDVCGNYQEGLARLAFGEADPAAERHAQDCPRCAETLAHLRRIRQAARPTFHAPESVILAAVGLMPTPEPRALRLLRSSLSGAMARSVTAASEFQMLFGEGDVSLRLGATRETGNRWRLLGQVEPEATIVRFEGQTIEVQAGRFSIVTPTLQWERFSLEVDDETYAVPPIAEVLDDGPG